MQDASFVARVDIPVSVFVRRDTTAGQDHGMVPCAADEFADIGISHQGTQDTLLPGHTGPQIAAISGSSCKIYGETKTCEIFAGGLFPSGSKLKSDANGHAVLCPATEQYSAIANQESTEAGQKVQVTVSRGTA